MGKILALDIGKKRVGLAISDEMRMIANPLTFIPFADLEGEIKNLIIVNDIDMIVAGLPRNMDGAEGSLAGFVRDTLEKIRVVLEEKVKLILVDETLSSVEAMSRLKARKKSIKEKGEIDMEAATIILENYLKENYAEQDKCSKKGG